MFEADRQMGAHRWPLVRLAAGSRTSVILLSERFFALTTHWVGHTVPCCGDGCPLCETLPARGVFYVAVFCASRVSLLELGAQSASHFEQHVKLLHGGMRPGHIVELSRRGAKSPVCSEVHGFKEKTISVLELDLAKHVMALFKFPPPGVDETLERYEVRVRGLTFARNVRYAEQMKHSTTPGLHGR